MITPSFFTTVQKEGASTSWADWLLDFSGETLCICNDTEYSDSDVRFGYMKNQEITAVEIAVKVILFCTLIIPLAALLIKAFDSPLPYEIKKIDPSTTLVLDRAKLYSENFSSISPDASHIKKLIFPRYAANLLWTPPYNDSWLRDFPNLESIEFENSMTKHECISAAIRHGRLNLARILISQGLQKKHTNQFRDTICGLISQAITNKSQASEKDIETYRELIHMLIEKGNNLLATDSYLHHAITTAMLTYDIDTLKLLIPHLPNQKSPSLNMVLISTSNHAINNYNRLFFKENKTPEEGKLLAKAKGNLKAAIEMQEILAKAGIEVKGLGENPLDIPLMTFDKEAIAVIIKKTPLSQAPLKVNILETELQFVQKSLTGKENRTHEENLQLAQTQKKLIALQEIKALFPKTPTTVLPKNLRV